LYSQTFSRQNPGCIIFVVDRSDSMRASWGGSNLTLAQGAAQAINKILFELCVKSTKEQNAPMRRYFYVGIYGYGLCPRRGGEGVESALPAALANRSIVPLPELAEHPLGVRDDPAADRTRNRRGMPVWYEPAHGYKTPTCAAIEMVGAHVTEWAGAFPNSFPAIVCHITDGLVTDSPYKGTDLAGWARRLTDIETRHGKTLLLNAFLAPSTAPITAFPNSARGLPAPGPDLFAMSSPLPEPMIHNAKAARLPVSDGARGFVFNADLATLVRFLQVGTQVSVQDEAYA
jgi:hypothetical protein